MSRTIRRKNQSWFFGKKTKAFGYFYDHDWVEGKNGWFLGLVAMNPRETFKKRYWTHGDFRGPIYRMNNPMTKEERKMEEKIFRAKEKQKIVSYTQARSEDVFGNKEPPPCPYRYWY